MKKGYYWLKLDVGFYNQKFIKVLKNMEKRHIYIVIYQKMLIESLKNDGRLYFDNFKDTFEEELSLIIDEELEDVRETIEFLKKADLIECNGDEFILKQIDELTGSESNSTKRVRKHRENKKKEKEECKKESITDETLCNVSCNKNVTTDIDIDKDIEKEIDIEKDTDLDKKIENQFVGECVDNNLSKITKLYEQNIGPLYPANRDWFVEVSEKIQYDLFKKAIEICIDKCNVNPFYLKGIIKKWMDQKIYTLEDFESKQNKITNKKSKKQDKLTEVEDVNEDTLKEIKLLEEKLGVV